MIDPKHYTGDPCYDATQHLLNCRGRLAAKPDKTISNFASLLGVDEHRVRAWTFARLAVGGWGDNFDQTQQLARLIPPT
jgi:streptomycin 6-kinase